MERNGRLITNVISSSQHLGGKRFSIMIGFTVFRSFSLVYVSAREKVPYEGQSLTTCYAHL